MKWLGWSIAVTAVLFLAAEVGLRALQGAAVIAIANPVMDDTDAGFVLRPGFRGRRWDTFVATDEHGFRDFPVIDSAGRRVTVVNLGDSTTFGVGLLAEQTYSSRLNLLLEQWRPGTYQVANLGVPGYSTREGLALVVAKKQLERLSADIVTVYFGWNDHWLRRTTGGAAAERSPSGLRRIKAFLSERLLLVQTIDLARARVSQKLRARGQRALNLAKLNELVAGEAARVVVSEVDPADLNVSPEDYLSNLSLLASSVRERGARLLVMVAPYGGADVLRDFIERHEVIDPRPFYYHDDYEQLTLIAAADAGFELIDLRPAFDGAGRQLFADPIHPNAAGHQIIAEHLFAAVAGPD